MSGNMSEHNTEDFEMSDIEISKHLSSKSPAPAAVSAKVPSSPPPVSGSTSSSHDDESEDSESLADGVEVISVSSRENSVDVEPLTSITIKSENRDDTKPSSSASAAGPSTAAIPASTSISNAIKPKSTKAARPRSPSPSPPPPPLPMQTVRLEFPLGGPDNYEVHISNMAKETGQRPPTPPHLVKRDLSDSEGDEEPEVDKSISKAKKKKKSAAAEYYDVHDPFIDDSELALDERTYFAQTKQQGFYVSSGEVALLKDKTPKKPKSRKPSTKNDSASAGPSSLPEGTKESPIALGSDDENAKPGQKRKRYSTVWENGKKRRVVNQNDFHIEIQQAVEELKIASSKEDWNNKGKFPPSIKPLLAQIALKAVELDEYDEHFFNLMSTLFPYNKFTITKLIKRTIFQDHVNLLNQRQAALLETLTTVTKEGFAKAQEEWEKTVTQWETRQAKLKDAGAKTGGEDGGAGQSISVSISMSASARQSTEDAGSGMDVDGPPLTQPENAGASAAVGGKAEPHAPSKKYRMTDQIKGIVWQLVTLSNECCRLENEKNSLEGTTTQISEQGLRKNLYQKIVAAFPEGWMSSGQISRDVSAMKKKFEKEALDNDG